jgi:hypothetical protein
MVGKDNWDIVSAGNPQGCISKQERVIGMNNLGKKCF